MNNSVGCSFAIAFVLMALVPAGVAAGAFFREHRAAAPRGWVLLWVPTATLAHYLLLGSLYVLMNSHTEEHWPTQMAFWAVTFLGAVVAPILMGLVDRRPPMVRPAPPAGPDTAPDDPDRHPKDRRTEP